VAGCLAQHARDWKADLVVMGSRGLGHVGGLFGRSVSHALLSKVDLPVLVVPAGAEVPDRGFRRVLVALRDLTEAEPAATAVRLLAPGAEVLAVHVPRALAVHAGTDPEESFLEVYETSDVVLRAVHRQMLHHGVRAFTRHLPRHGNVAEAIAGAAHEWDADLVALGSRRLHLWEALIAGSTSQDVIRLSDRPVLILGRPAYEAPAGDRGDRESHELRA
jgi:nucleotide-binding universal stress UspA family protein